MLFFDNLFVLFDDDWLLDLTNDILMLLMDNRLVDLVNLFLVNDGLMVFMHDVLHLLVDDILVMLDDHVLMVLMNHITVVLCDDGGREVSLNLGWNDLLVIDSWQILSLQNGLLIVPDDTYLRLHSSLDYRFIGEALGHACGLSDEGGGSGLGA